LTFHYINREEGILGFRSDKDANKNTKIPMCNIIKYKDIITTDHITGFPNFVFWQTTSQKGQP